MSDLLKRLQKNSKLQAGTLANSSLFQGLDNTPTEMPVLNLAFSGELDKGFRAGVVQLAGPSKHYKSNLALICVKAYLDQNPDGFCLFYDCEFGITREYLISLGIDPSRVVHIPIETVEDLKFEIVNQLKEKTKSDKVIIMIDSLGNLASKKELEDAQNEKSAQDMSRAKALKSLFRMITPSLTIKDVPLIAIAHTYKTMDLFPKDVVSGGQGQNYAANSTFILGRQQEKDTEGVQGWNFVINVDKSRDVREKSKLSFLVLYESGVQKYSGLLDIALATGHVVKPSNGWFSRIIDGTQEDKKHRRAETSSKEFWDPLLKDETFKTACRKLFKLSSTQVIESNTGTEVEDDIELSPAIGDDHDE